MTRDTTMNKAPYITREELPYVGQRLSAMAETHEYLGLENHEAIDDLAMAAMKDRMPRANAPDDARIYWEVRQAGYYQSGVVIKDAAIARDRKKNPAKYKAAEKLAQETNQ